MQLRVALLEPRGNCGVEFVEVAGKEVVGVFDHNEAILAKERGNSFFHFLPRAELIFAAVNE